MLNIRLSRVGRKNDPSFRVVLIDSKRAPKSGAFLEILGSYDPRKKRVQLDNERIKHWISVGAQPSDTVHNLLVNASVINAPKKTKGRSGNKQKEQEKAPEVAIDK
jgi:small subunit ribosomal protein S16